MSITNTLMEIAKQSKLNKAEKTSLDLIAKEVKKLLTELRKLRKESKT